MMEYNISKKQYSSYTKLRGQIHIGDNYTYLTNINVDWTLTQNQQNIYPLINRIKKHNHLAIYDTDTTGKYDSKTNPKIAVSSYSNLKTLFNNQYKKDTSDITDYYTQYTNFTTDLKNKIIFTNGNNSLFDLKIHSLDKKSIYEDKDFIINFYNIKNIGDSLNRIYNYQIHETVSYKWWNSDANSQANDLLRQIVANYGNIDNITKIINFKDKIFFTDNNGQKTGKELPMDNSIKTVQIHYNNQLLARIRVDRD